MALNDLRKAPPQPLPRQGSFKTQQAAARLDRRQSDAAQYLDERFAPAYAWLYSDDDPPVTLDTAGNVWVTWAPTLATENAAMAWSNSLLTVRQPGLFWLQSDFSIFRDVYNADVFGSPFVNGVERPRLGFRIEPAASAECQAGGGGLLYLGAGDTLRYKFQQAAAATLQLYKGSVVLMKVAP